MKKICQILLALFILGFLLQIIYVFFRKNYTLIYDVRDGNDHFLVEEKYVAGTKETKGHYEITIDHVFTYQIYENLHKDSRLVKSVQSYKDEKYRCIYPQFKNKKVIRDVLCTDGKEQIYYHSIEGHQKLDAFVSKLSNYDASYFKDKKEDIEKKGFLTLYKENLLFDHSLVIQNYKGVDVVKGEKIDSVTLYSHDVYDPKLSSMAHKYFVTADYEDKFSFHKFYVLDVTGTSKKEISTKYEISYDSYIQGTLSNAVYLLDTENKKQYKIDIKEKNVRLIGDSNKGILFYESGKWISKEMRDAISEPLYFNSSVSSNENYERVEKGADSLYTYFFEKQKDGVRVTRKGANEKKRPTYLFKVKDMRMIQYAKDFIYFASGDTIYYYSDKTGLRTVLDHSEFSFNKDLRFFIYVP